MQGDIHSIGKNIVATLLFPSGFEVFDLGEDVPIINFINKAKEIEADIIAASALLTITMPEQKNTVEKVKAEGMAAQVETMFGDSPCTAEWIKEIGGDGYAENAFEAVRVVHTLLGINE